MTTTQTQVIHDRQTRHWIHTLYTEPPDQTVQLISSADECYRGEDDECLDDDETLSMSEGSRSRVSAGDQPHKTYTAQLVRNNIVNNNGGTVFKAWEWDSTFEYENLLATAQQVPEESLRNVQEHLSAAGNEWDLGFYTGNEYQFQVVMQRLLINIIDPEAYVHDINNGWKDYEATGPGLWNYGARCLAHMQNLSQPKVDFCLSLSMKQSVSEGDSPLVRVCRRVETRKYRSKDIRGPEVQFDQASRLLSLETQRLFLAYPRLREVCFCHQTQVRDFGNFPITWVEFKWSEKDMPVAVNQMVNGNVVSLGKQGDLLIEARKMDSSAVLPEWPACLGMCIAGKQWKIIGTFSRPTVLLGRAFDYDVVCEGDWQAEPQKFIGAVIAMHEYNENRTVRLLLACFDVFNRWISTQAKMDPSSDMAFQARFVPGAEKLAPVQEEAGVAAVGGGSTGRRSAKSGASKQKTSVKISKGK